MHNRSIGHSSLFSFNCNSFIVNLYRSYWFIVTVFPSDVSYIVIFIVFYILTLNGQNLLSPPFQMREIVESTIKKNCATILIKI